MYYEKYKQENTIQNIILNFKQNKIQLKKNKTKQKKCP